MQMDFGVMIIDEVHHIISDSYAQLLSCFGSGTVKLVGLTATSKGQPKQTKKIYSYFTDDTFNYSLPDAISDGWLVEPEINTIKIKANSVGKYDTSTPETVNQCIDILAKETEGLRTIIYCKSKSHAWQVVNKLYKKTKGERRIFYVDAVDKWEFVGGKDIFGSTGTKPIISRKEAYNQFASSNGAVIVNINVINEGVDIDNVEAIFNLRLTSSNIYWMQTLGRGTRPLRAIMADLKQG